MPNDDPADALFAVPPAAFVAARNHLATDLRKSGKKEAAAVVKALSKPSVTVWATNQLARNHPRDLQRFIDVSDDVLRAQGAGRGDEATREKYQTSLAAQRQALDPLIEQAAKICTAHEITPTRTTLDRVANNLRWGAIDQAARIDLAQGRLRLDLDPPDFSTLVGRIPALPGDADPSPQPAGEVPTHARVISPQASRPANDAQAAPNGSAPGAAGDSAKARAAARNEAHALKEQLRPQEAQLQRLRAKASGLLSTQERAAQAVRDLQTQLEGAQTALERAQAAHDQAVAAAEKAAAEVGATREKLAAAEASARSNH